MLEEMAQQAELGRSQSDERASPPDFVRDDVQFEITIAQQFARERRTAPTLAISSPGLKGLVT
jgi:hypothetical protein